jgi:hypothetical protein
MRLKLKYGLSERDPAPHVFETKTELQAFTSDKPGS